jgi:hypothetical protein
MSRIASLGSWRTVLLVLAFALTGAALFLAPSHPAAALVCNPNLGLCLGTDVTYYNNANHGKKVGECDCGNCTGEETAYFISLPKCCPCD